MKTFADKVIRFNRLLDFTGKLPANIGVMNPFKESKEALLASSAFYKKYYADTNPRHFIIGINPGRHGAGLTGVPFTDPKRLKEKCQIDYHGKQAHEPSSVFIYDMIEAFGGETDFYTKFYINSICPLGFVIRDSKGREKNYNYYDTPALKNASHDFILHCIKKQIEFGIETDVCFCLGTGKNLKFLNELNAQHKFFGKIIALEHPRYIIQYKAKSKQEYIRKFIQAFRKVK